MPQILWKTGISSEALGRNGRMIQKGVYVTQFPGDEVVRIHPINSKYLCGKGYIEIPKSELENVIGLLTEELQRKG